MKVYVASPLGFSEAGRHFYEAVLIPRLEELGCTVIDPWKLTDQSLVDPVLAMPYGSERRDAWRRLNPVIGENNLKGLAECDMVLAVLDGVDVDSGTAAEIGCAFEKGKVIVGYRGDFRLSADNDGSSVNLQVEHFIRKSGGDIITSTAQLAEAISAARSELHG